MSSTGPRVCAGGPLAHLGPEPQPPSCPTGTGVSVAPQPESRPAVSSSQGGTCRGPRVGGGQPLPACKAAGARPSGCAHRSLGPRPAPPPRSQPRTTSQAPFSIQSGGSQLAGEPHREAASTGRGSPTRLLARPAGSCAQTRLAQCASADTY